MQRMLDMFADSFRKFPNHNAFHIKNTYYTYNQLGQVASNIRKQLEDTNASHKIVGIVSNDDIYTYGAMLGCWFAGYTWVPLNPSHPIDRVESIIELAEIQHVFASETVESFDTLFSQHDLTIVATAQLPEAEMNMTNPALKDEDTAYILFTSGSTGVPKGVPIKHSSLSAYMDANFALNYNLDENDRFLQMFELTFDASVVCYCLPLCLGSCIYTVPSLEIKFTEVYRLLEDFEITFCFVVPSILSHLRPYFDELNFDKMKYSVFCGEALYEDITHEWAKCCPNARIQNFYGPTEATVYCSVLEFEPGKPNKAYNGIVAIGKEMKGTTLMVVDENNKPVPVNTPGELCIAGPQLTDGYWKNPEKNAEVFFMHEMNGEMIRFYRTGDLCYKDEDGDYFYSGRIDNQVQIQGFRVELSEIEFHAKDILGLTPVVAIAYDSEIGTTQVHMFIENYQEDLTPLKEHLKAKLPSYMIPTNYTVLDVFPLNVNGKIDRKTLKQSLEEK